MKAGESLFLPFLDGTKQFIIPIYQRTYGWSLDQCRQLWDDIIGATNNSAVTTHFVGSIVYVQQGIINVGSVPQFLVIDGQQRLTTLTLLLAALARAVQSLDPDSEINSDQVWDSYILNRYAKGNLRYKLLLTQSDRDTLIRLLEGKDLPERASRRIVANYEFFREQLAQPGIDPAAVYRGIAKLVIVDISLDRSHDNPQLIFESLNSTGLELSQADLIRNYVLMGLSPDQMVEIYNEHWFPMEQRFGHADYATLFDRFMRDYLTVRTGTIPNIRDVYTAFKAYARQPRAGTIPDIVADVSRFARYFVNMDREQESDSELHRAFHDINVLKVDVAFPLLLQLYDDYANGRLTRDDFLAVVRLVESYVFRRAICGIPTNSMNKTFAALGRDMNGVNVRVNLGAALLALTSYRRFPDDEEFRRQFVIKDVYNFRSRNYLLSKLENAQHRDHVNIEAYTIEHIMPQNENLSLLWQQELGADWKGVQARWLHTVGNLTLTLYNPELSDRPFLEKRDMDGGLSKTPLRLNDGLRTLNHWNGDTIKERAETLASLASAIWAAPMVDGGSKLVTKITPPTGPHTLSDYPQLVGEMGALFQKLRTRILNIDSSVTEVINKQYIAYKAPGNFAEIAPQTKRLLLYLDLPFDAIDDPAGIAKDVTGIGHWGTGSVEVGVTPSTQLDDVMLLVQQAFNCQGEDSDQ